jgi:hypothetical protein
MGKSLSWTPQRLRHFAEFGVEDDGGVCGPTIILHTGRKRSGSVAKKEFANAIICGMNPRL